MQRRGHHNWDTIQQRDAEEMAQYTGYKSAEGWREEGSINGIHISRGMEGRGRHRLDTSQQRDGGERAP